MSDLILHVTHVRYSTCNVMLHIHMYYSWTYHLDTCVSPDMTHMGMVMSPDMTHVGMVMSPDMTHVGMVMSPDMTHMGMVMFLWSKLRGGSTNPNAYNQFLMTAERNRGHMCCQMPSEFIQRKKIRAQAGIEPTTLGVLAHYSNH